MSFESNKVINGLYGKVFDENGRQLSSAQEFEANLEFEKEEIKIPGKLMAGHKVLGASGSGSVMFLKLDSRLQRKIAENPAAKYNYMAELADPTAAGEEAILFTGVSFDGTPLIGFTLGEITEVELDFTFDDYRYIDSID